MIKIAYQHDRYGDPLVTPSDMIIDKPSGVTLAEHMADTSIHGGSIIRKALNMMVIVPQGTTYSYGNPGNYVTDPMLPNPAVQNTTLTLESPFGPYPCLAQLMVKKDDAWVIGSSVYDGFNFGPSVNAPGDGYVHVSTGQGAQDADAPAYEMVIVLWCATNELASGSGSQAPSAQSIDVLDCGYADVQPLTHIDAGASNSFA